MNQFLLPFNLVIAAFQGEYRLSIQASYIIRDP